MRAINHPRETTLALHAGGDLGPIARWRCARHLRQCEACQEEIAAFQGMRRMVADMSGMPEIPWSRLAAEMAANIRLGLAAGECVGGNRPQTEGRGRFTGLRAALALASLTLVAAAGLWLQKPPAAANRTVLEAAADSRRDARIKDVSYSANAEGSTGDCFVDPVTGDVTIRREW
jgi:hypothetical protein